MNLLIFSFYSLLETSHSILFEFTSKWFILNFVPPAHQAYLPHGSHNPRNQTCQLRFIKFMIFLIMLTLSMNLKFTSDHHQLNFTRLYTKIDFAQLQLIFCSSCTNFSRYLLSTSSSFVGSILLTYSSKLNRYFHPLQL